MHPVTMLNWSYAGALVSFYQGHRKTSSLEVLLWFVPNRVDTRVVNLAPNKLSNLFANLIPNRESNR